MIRFDVFVNSNLIPMIGILGIVEVLFDNLSYFVNKMCEHGIGSLKFLQEYCEILIRRFWLSTKQSHLIYLFQERHKGRWMKPGWTIPFEWEYNVLEQQAWITYWRRQMWSLLSAFSIESWIWIYICPSSLLCAYIPCLPSLHSPNFAVH